MEERLLQTATIETCHLAAIMFTDIAGFSRQMGANEARELLAKIYGWFTEGFDTRRICKKPKPFSGNSREREISQGDRAWTSSLTLFYPVTGMRQNGKRAILPGRDENSNCSMQDSTFMDWTNAFLEGSDLSRGDKEKIYSGNAERILKMRNVCCP